MLVRSLFLALSLLYVCAPAWAANLKLAAVDYGVPGEPFNNPILPGGEGQIFLTLSNESEEVLNKLSLQLYPGDCVESVQRDPLEIATVGAKETIRVNSPVRIKIKATCSREKPASFLLIGTYRDVSGVDQRIWAEVSFAVAPYPTVDFLGDNLNLTIPAVGTVFYDFQVVSGMSIRQIGVYVKLQHTDFGDLRIVLQHPSGRTVILRDSRSGSGLQELRYGLGGDPTPALNTLLTLPAVGTWRLTVIDSRERDSGILHAVGLSIR